MPETPWAQGDFGLTFGICGAIGDGDQVMLAWVIAPGDGNASHPQRLGVTRAGHKLRVV